MIVRHEEADLCHTSRHEITANAELLARCRGQIYAAEFRDVRAKPYRSRPAVEQAGVRRYVEALDNYIDDGPRADGIACGVGNLSETERH